MYPKNKPRKTAAKWPRNADTSRMTLREQAVYKLGLAGEYQATIASMLGFTRERARQLWNRVEYILLHGERP